MYIILYILSEIKTTENIKTIKLLTLFCCKVQGTTITSMNKSGNRL